MTIARPTSPRLVVRLLLIGAALLLAGLGTVTAVAPANAAPLRPVASLDPARYLGQWWQLATVPSFYGVRCARDTNATYTKINDTTIGVNNRCTSFTGMSDGIKGQAKIVDPVTKAQLVVSFPGIPFAVNPGNTPNYIVSYVEDGDSPTAPYQYAIVGDPTRSSGFLLSRDKVVPTSELRRLRTKIESVGFNPCTFLISPTTGGRSDYSPLCLV